MEVGPRYLEGTTVGSGRDIIGVRRDRIAAIIEQGREIIARAKQERILPDTTTGPTAADLARLRTIITQEQFLNVARNVGYSRFIRRLDDGRWVCELTPKLEDLPDE